MTRERGRSKADQCVPSPTKSHSASQREPIAPEQSKLHLLPSSVAKQILTVTWTPHCPANRRIAQVNLKLLCFTKRGSDFRAKVRASPDHRSTLHLCNAPIWQGNP